MVAKGGDKMSREEEIKDMKKPDKGGGYSVEVQASS